MFGTDNCAGGCTTTGSRPTCTALAFPEHWIINAHRKNAESATETESNVSAETSRASALYDPHGISGGDADAQDSYAARRADALVMIAESMLARGAAIRRALKSRDAGCVFPGCTARHFWDGTSVDYPMAVDAMLSCDGALQLEAGASYAQHFPRQTQDFFLSSNSRAAELMQ